MSWSDEIGLSLISERATGLEGRNEVIRLSKKGEGSQVLKKSMSSIAAATMKKLCKLFALIEQKVKAASFVTRRKPKAKGHSSFCH